MISKRTLIPLLFASWLFLDGTEAFAQARIALDTVALTGAPAPGANGATFAFLRDPILNKAGEVGFIAPLTGAGVTSDNSRGLWIGRPGNLALAVRTGDL